MSMEEEAYHSTLATTKATAIKWPGHIGSGELNLFRRWLINRKRNTDIDGKNKWEKPVWGSTEEEMMRWKEEGIESTREISPIQTNTRLLFCIFQLFSSLTPSSHP